jgi:hypothetical protein
MNTVNVIEVFNGSINSLQAFADNEDGNALAEKIFHDILYCIKFVDDRLE